MRIAKSIELSDRERLTLTRWARGRRTPSRLVQRAKIILSAAGGMRNDEIASELGCTRRTVGTWRNRFAKHRLMGIEKDAAPPKRPKLSPRRRRKRRKVPRTGAYGRWRLR